MALIAPSFLYGFAKNERENISSGELLSLTEIADIFLNASKQQIAQALKDETLIEVQDGSEDKKENDQ